MHEAGLMGKRPKEKYHSYRGAVGKIADNLIDRVFSTTVSLQKWTTDVSQFNFSWGKCYISSILDMHTNEIISYDLAKSPNLAQSKCMVKKAFNKFSNLKGLIFHSDQGLQYQHVSYRTELQKHSIIQSMSRKGIRKIRTMLACPDGRQRNTSSRREYLPYTKGNPRGKCEDSFALWLNIGYNIATRKELILCRLFQCVI